MPVVQEHPAEHEKEAEARPQLQAGVTGEEHHLHDDQPEVDDIQLRCQKGIPAGAALPHIAVHEEHVELQQRHGDKEQPAADLFPLRGGPIPEEVHFLPEPAAHLLRKGHFFQKGASCEPDKAQSPADEHKVQVSVDAGGEQRKHCVSSSPHIWDR